MKTSRIIPLFMAFMVITLTLPYNSCKKQDENTATTTVPVLLTKNASGITNSTAEVGGVITGNGGTSITERGVCYSTSANPTVIDNTETSELGTGTYELTLTELNPATEYYYKAYAINSVGIGYGDQKSFTTQEGGGGSILTDPRDGQEYEVVTIGSQTWMAENLNYQTGNSWCYNDDPAYCAIYGRLYDWDTFMNGASSSNSVPSGVQGVCPPGWHVPSDEEWTILTYFLGGSAVAGGEMKETGTSHWSSPNTGATNSSGFTALPGGRRETNGSFHYLTTWALFWSSTEFDPDNAIYRFLRSNNTTVSSFSQSKTQARSARCLQD